MKVYLDNAATTPIDFEVLEVMTEALKLNYGNPSSIHSVGRIARNAIETSRKKIAHILRASTSEIFFTSSATESNNMAIHCSIRDLGIKRVISSPTEHPCILNTLKAAQEYHGVKIEFVSVDGNGNIDYEQLEQLLADSQLKTMVSIMHGNNEIGTVSDLERISKLCEEHKALFHCDTVQTLGKYDIDLSKTNISFLSGSGHKMYGPKGIGIIYVNNNNLIQSLIRGGGQERNMRSGTENVYGIMGFARAFEKLYEKREEFLKHTGELRTYFKAQLSSSGLDIVYNGNQESNFLPHIINLSIPVSDKTDLIMFNLDIHGICASAGSACSSGVEHESPVLAAINAPMNRKAIRFSLSHGTTKEEIDYTVQKLKEIV